jgi:hypothetical protein
MKTTIIEQIEKGNGYDRLCVAQLRHPSFLSREQAYWFMPLWIVLLITFAFVNRYIARILFIVYVAVVFYCYKQIGTMKIYQPHQFKEGDVVTEYQQNGGKITLLKTAKHFATL